MPEISELKIINISPERFLYACSPGELYELDQLIQRRVYQDKIRQVTGDEILTPCETCDQEITHELLIAMSHE